MPSQNTAGILIGGTLLAVVVVVLVVEGLADSVTGFLLNLGIPSQIATDINAVVFFGLLFLIIVLVLKTISQLSRV